MGARGLVAAVVAGLLLLGGGCTADLNDVDTCYAIARAYCDKAVSCDPDVGAVNPGDTSCVSVVYGSCASKVSIHGTTSSLLGTIQNAHSCVTAIHGTACGQGAGSACGSLPPLPAAGGAESASPDGGPSPADASAALDVAAQ